MYAHFKHEVMFYGDREEFLEGAVPFLRGALEAEEPALVAVANANAGSLKAELGPDARRVRFADMEELGRNPARILPLWRDFVDANAGPARGIGEPVWPRRTPAEIDECQRHESLLNVAFADARAWRLLCPYDSSALNDGVLEAARDSHRYISADGARVTNPGGADPRAADPHAGELPVPPAGARSFRFARGTLRDARGLVALEAEKAGLSVDRAFDLVAATGELLGNSVTHGGGSGALSVWEETGVLVVDVADKGRIDDPLVGRVRPEPTQDGGRGLWLANHLCDLVRIRSGPSGTAVRIQMSRN